MVAIHCSGQGPSDAALKERERIGISTEELQETLSVVRKANPRNNRSLGDIARLHELHARHEREAGRLERAAAAEERARRIRLLAESREHNANEPLRVVSLPRVPP